MKPIRFSLLLVAVAFFLFASPGQNDTVFAGNPCNPCAKNPCNPCGGKKMKNACNPCAKNPCNPCNPCASAPPKPIRSTHVTDLKKLVAQGKALWNDDNLGTSGFSCMTCHDEYENLHIDKHHGVYPHYVGMPKDVVTLDQMINFCIINPLAGEQIDPNGIKMTAMAAYYREYLKSWKPGMGVENPCNPCNPCGGKNPCNPCGR